VHIPHWLFDILIFLSAAILVVPALSVLRISPVLGYLLAGFLLGAGGLDLIKDGTDVDGLAELGIVFLLFTIGLELSFDRLRRLARLVFGLGLLQVGLTAAVIAALCLAVGMGVSAAFAISTALALSSTAFVLQLLAERGERSTRAGQTGFAILLFQDLAIVPLLIILPVLAAGSGDLLPALGLALVEAVLAVAAVISLGRFVLQPAFRWLVGHGESDVFIGTTLLVVLGLGVAMALAGLSLALGAFLAGLLLAETEYRHQIESDIRPFRGILLGLFFMTVGMKLDPVALWQNLALVLAITGGLTALKAAMITGLATLFGLRWRQAVQTGLLLSQGGEFAFVLLGQAGQLGIVGTDISQIVIAAIIITMVITPALAALGAAISARETSATDTVQGPSLTADAAAMADHILILGYGRVGLAVSKLVEAYGLGYIALDTDHTEVRSARANGRSVYYGDATNMAVLHSAGIDRVLAVVITIDRAATAVAAAGAIRRDYADLPVIVRARDTGHSDQLIAAGASFVVPDTLEASLQLGSFVLQSGDADDEEIRALLARFREDDYALLTDTDSTAQG